MKSSRTFGEDEKDYRYSVECLWAMSFVRSEWDGSGVGVSFPPTELQLCPLLKRVVPRSACFFPEHLFESSQQSGPQFFV